VSPDHSILIEAGRHWKPDCDDDSLYRVPREYFHALANGRFNAFSFLEGLSFEDAFAFTRGLVLCERMGVSPYPGSTSLVIWAFVVIRNRPEIEWTQIADWIVANQDNPYSPFNSRRTRDHWLAARGHVSDPIEMNRLAARLERQYAERKHATGEREGIRQLIARFKKRGTLPDSPALRERMQEEMEREALGE
jgi:hypothetical protein